MSWACGPWGCDLGGEIEWVARSGFSGRTITLYSPSRVVAVDIADGDIVCDLCNDPIEDDPIAVWLQRYALCRHCLQRVAGR
jgi:hypothetical protein